MCYSNNRKSLYYSCVAGKTYGGINSVTVLFNITSPRPGTPEQLENGANHSIKQTDVSDLMYSLLNTTVLPFGFALHLLSHVLVEGPGVILVYLMYLITCLFLLLCAMFCICKLCKCLGRRSAQWVERESHVQRPQVRVPAWIPSLHVTPPLSHPVS